MQLGAQNATVKKDEKKKRWRKEEFTGNSKEINKQTGTATLEVLHLHSGAAEINPVLATTRTCHFLGRGKTCPGICKEICSLNPAARSKRGNITCRVISK